MRTFEKRPNPARPSTLPSQKVNGHEQEANRVADSVAAQVTPSNHSTADSNQLTPSLRTKLEDTLGWNLSSVRIHTDNAAGKEAQALGARAFTKGNDIFFSPGTFQPHTPAGIHLLGHELAHVNQQNSGSVAQGTIQKEDWNFTPDKYKALLKKKSDLRFDSDSAWFPSALRDNLLTTLKFALTSTKPARTEGVNIKDFYHGHFVIPKDEKAKGLISKRSDFESKSEKLQGKALGGDWFGTITKENLPAYTKAMQDTEKLATPLLEEALKIKGAAVLYHTFEQNTPPSMDSGSPIRNIMTPIGGSPAGYDPSGAGKDANQYTDNNIPILQFAFLVDETGVIHVTTGSFRELSRVTGSPINNADAPK